MFRAYTIRIIREKVAAATGVDVDQLKRPEIKVLLSKIVDGHVASLLKNTVEAAESEPKALTKSARAKPKSRNNAKTLTKLKACVVQCGVRKIWKREFDGLSEAEAIKKVRLMLVELGVEGNPTVEKCEKVRAKRELSEDIRALDPNQSIQKGERRRRCHQLPSESDPEVSQPRLDLSAFGDPDSE